MAIYVFWNAENGVFIWLHVILICRLFAGAACTGGVRSELVTELGGYQSFFAAIAPIIEATVKLMASSLIEKAWRPLPRCGHYPKKS